MKVVGVGSVGTREWPPEMLGSHVPPGQRNERVIVTKQLSLLPVPWLTTFAYSFDRLLTFSGWRRMKPAIRMFLVGGLAIVLSLIFIAGCQKNDAISQAEKADKINGVDVPRIEEPKAIAEEDFWRHNLKTVRRLAMEHGGLFVDGIHFPYERRPVAL
jgi:hypothetical protein